MRFISPIVIFCCIVTRDCSEIIGKKLGHYNPGYKGLYNIDRLATNMKGKVDVPDYSREVLEKNPFYSSEVLNHDVYTSSESPELGPFYSEETSDSLSPNYSADILKYPNDGTSEDAVPSHSSHPFSSGSNVNLFIPPSQLHSFPIEYHRQPDNTRVNQHFQHDQIQSSFESSSEQFHPPIAHTPWETILQTSPAQYEIYRLKSPNGKHKPAKPIRQPPNSIQSDLLAPVEFLVDGMVKRVSHAFQDVSKVLKAPPVGRNDVITGVGGVLGSLALAAGAYYLLVVNGPTPVIHARSYNNDETHESFRKVRQLVDASLRLYNQYEFGNPDCHRRTVCQFIITQNTNKAAYYLNKILSIPSAKHIIGWKTLSEKSKEDCDQFYPNCKASIGELLFDGPEQVKRSRE